MYVLKKIGKVFTSKFVGTGPSSYKKRIYRAAVSQSLRNTALSVPVTEWSIVVSTPVLDTESAATNWKQPDCLNITVFVIISELDINDCYPSKLE